MLPPAFLAAVLVALFAPRQEPDETLALGRPTTVSLDAGAARTLVVVPERPGALTVDAMTDGGEIALRAVELDTVVLSRYRSGAPPDFARVVVAVEHEGAILFDVENAGDAPVEAVLTAKSGVWEILRGPEEERAEAQLALGGALEARSWSNDAALALHFSAEADYAARRLARCTDSYRRVLELADRAGRGDLAAIARVRLGAVRLALGEPAAALEELELGLEAAREQEHRPLELVALIVWGQAARKLGRLDEARARLGEALELARATNDAGASREVRRELARVEWRAGRFDEAEAHLRSVREEVRAAGDPGELASCLLIEGELRRERGELTRARALLEEALAMELPVGFRLEVLGQLGNLEQDCGNDLAALDCFEQVLALARETGAADLEARALLSAGRRNLWLGNWDRARSRLDSALERIDPETQPALRAEGLRIRADLDLATGTVEAALPRIEEALAIAEPMGDPELLASVLASRVDILLRRERPEDAVAPARRVAKIGREHGLPILEGVGLDLEAEARLRQGDLAAAGRLSKSALERLRSAGDRDRLQWALLTAVDIAVRSGDVETALRCVDEAETCFDRPDAVRADPAQLARRRATDLYALWAEHGQDAVALALSAGKPDAERRRALVAEGFRRAGFWKGRSLLQEILERRRGTRQGQSAALARDLGDARAEERHLGEAIAESRREGADRRADALGRRLEATRGRLDDLQARWRAASPREAALDLADGVAPDRLAELLPPDDALIEYAAGKQRLFAYSLVGGELALHDLGERAEVEAEVAAFLDGIGRPGRLAPPAEVARRGRRLFDLLLAPLLPAATGARLVVVPTPELAALPFGALVEEAPAGVASFRDVTFVLDRREVSYASATSVLAYLAELGPRVRPGPALVLADPVYASEAGGNSDGGPVARGSWARLEGTRDEALAVTSALLEARGEEALARELPRRFARERSFSLRDEAVELHLGDRAAPERLTGDLRRFAVLHCASHGRIDPEHPARSGLVLSAADGGDGVLTESAILGLDLDAELAVLSACETGRGAVQRGEGVQSLARAFLVAGARGVICSLWPVDDRETQEVMAEFYEDYVGRGEPESTALRAAKLAVRREGATEGAFRGLGRGLPLSGGEDPVERRSATTAAERAGHPFFWASFVYLGRPD